ncbi:anti-sigma factor antagonist [Micromonospora zhanjiangensis]|uniref:Anti-sigma factor antagonist n=1 Tax=Micromonospora zhanjiangensis TaxID=1522057 RepID=A0ABV8KT10_9ACTN
MTDSPAALAAVRPRYLECLGEADEYGATDVALGLLADGVPAEDVLLGLIVPAQEQVGRWWQSNEWSVAQEHAATHISERVVAAVSSYAGPRPNRGRVVVACMDGEWHALPPRTAARGHGARTIASLQIFPHPAPDRRGQAVAITITYAERGEIARLHLTGELDMATAPELTSTIEGLLADGRHRLLVDLGDLGFCDSAGMAAFVRGDNRSRELGGWLRLTGATGRVARVLEISGLAEVLRYEHDRDDPVALPER